MSENNSTLNENPEIAQRLRTAFPSSISEEVNKTLAFIPAARIKPSTVDIGKVIIRGETVHIPARIYSPEPFGPLLKVMDRINLSILACLYTRHHDGYIRQKYVNYLFEFDDVWIPPFVLQLVGEYVIEIIEDIYEAVPRLPVNLYKDFITENPAFIQLLKQRIISYWNAYFRYPHFKKYVGYQVGDAFGMWTSHDVKRIG